MLKKTLHQCDLAGNKNHVWDKVIMRTGKWKMQNEQKFRKHTKGNPIRYFQLVHKNGEFQLIDFTGKWKTTCDQNVKHHS